MLATDKGGTTQDKWYDKGVGTAWYDRLSGGTFGVGLSKNILEGYRQLVRTYEEGDLIYIFGFSRGPTQHEAWWA
ncbi:phospholipase effector Tle1 domain-containing protein [Pseudomonas arcuscaelestis]|uniref:phospholipase effector Tle1 domain-containing protein n=1 Tax=Pseudomonas TaxID=286 RepID=UPI0039A53D9C